MVIFEKQVFQIIQVIQLCILFYYLGEYFERAGKELIIKTIDNFQDTIYKKTDDYYANVAYGVHWIESNTNNIIRWTLEMIDNIQSGDGMIIGIISKETDIGVWFICITLE